MESLLKLFCDVDDFCKIFLPGFNKRLIEAGDKQRNRAHRMHLSEMMAIMIYFHQSHYRNFKKYYTEHVFYHLKNEFPRQLSYVRFVRLMPSLLVPLVIYLETRKAPVTGISFIDSSKLAVCHNLRINRHRVFADVAGRGKTSMGWFYGLKLHLVVNDEGGLLAYGITSANVDDRKPVKMLAKKLWGKMFGDRGYISKNLCKELWDQGLHLITTLRRNMKNMFMTLSDKLLLRKRFIIETINDQLKNISQIEHTRHRSVTNCFVNIIAGLIAYTHQSKKPYLNLNKQLLSKAINMA